MAKSRELAPRKDSAVQTGALVKVQVGSLAATETPVGTWLFGFDPTQPENIDNVFRCDADGTREWTQHTTEDFLLHTWAAQKIFLPETEDRDASEQIRVVLINTDGDTLSFVSQGVVTSLDLIRALLGDGPFDPPVPVTFENIKTTAGRSILKIRPHLDRMLGKKK
jgi:hypothetical protein